MTPDVKILAKKLDNYALKSWLKDVGSVRRREFLRKIKRQLQSQYLTNDEVRCSLIQLMSGCSVQLPKNLYRYLNSSNLSPKTEDVTNQDSTFEDRLREFSESPTNSRTHSEEDFETVSSCEKGIKTVPARTNNLELESSKYLQAEPFREKSPTSLSTENSKFKMNRVILNRNYGQNTNSQKHLKVLKNSLNCKNNSKLSLECKENCELLSRNVNCNISSNEENIFSGNSASALVKESLDFSTCSSRFSTQLPSESLTFNFNELDNKKIIAETPVLLLTNDEDSSSCALSNNSSTSITKDCFPTEATVSLQKNLSASEKELKNHQNNGSAISKSVQKKKKLEQRFFQLFGNDDDEADKNLDNFPKRRKVDSRDSCDSGAYLNEPSPITNPESSEIFSPDSTGIECAIRETKTCSFTRKNYNLSRNPERNNVPDSSTHSEDEAEIVGKKSEETGNSDKLSDDLAKAGIERDPILNTYVFSTNDVNILMDIISENMDFDSLSKTSDGRNDDVNLVETCRNLAKGYSSLTKIDDFSAKIDDKLVKIDDSLAKIDDSVKKDNLAKTDDSKLDENLAKIDASWTKIDTNYSPALISSSNFDDNLARRNAWESLHKTEFKRGIVADEDVKIMQEIPIEDLNLTQNSKSSTVESREQEIAIDDNDDDLQILSQENPAGDSIQQNSVQTEESSTIPVEDSIETDQNFIKNEEISIETHEISIEEEINRIQIQGLENGERIIDDDDDDIQIVEIVKNSHQGAKFGDMSRVFNQDYFQVLTNISGGKCFRENGDDFDKNSPAIAENSARTERNTVLTHGNLENLVAIDENCVKSEQNSDGIGEISVIRGGISQTGTIPPQIVGGIPSPIPIIGGIPPPIIGGISPSTENLETGVENSVNLPVILSNEANETGTEREESPREAPREIFVPRLRVKNPSELGCSRWSMTPRPAEPDENSTSDHLPPPEINFQSQQINPVSIRADPLSNPLENLQQITNRMQQSRLIRVAPPPYPSYQNNQLNYQQNNPVATSNSEESTTRAIRANRDMLSLLKNLVVPYTQEGLVNICKSFIQLMTEISANTSFLRDSYRNRPLGLCTPDLMEYNLRMNDQLFNLAQFLMISFEERGLQFILDSYHDMVRQPTLNNEELKYIMSVQNPNLNPNQSGHDPQNNVLRVLLQTNPRSFPRPVFQPQFRLTSNPRPQSPSDLRFVPRFSDSRLIPRNQSPGDVRFSPDSRLPSRPVVRPNSSQRSEPAPVPGPSTANKKRSRKKKQEVIVIDQNPSTQELAGFTWKQYKTLQSQIQDYHGLNQKLRAVLRQLNHGDDQIQINNMESIPVVVLSKKAPGSDPNSGTRIRVRNFASGSSELPIPNSDPLCVNSDSLCANSDSLVVNSIPHCVNSDPDLLVETSYSDQISPNLATITRISSPIALNSKQFGNSNPVLVDTNLVSENSDPINDSNPVVENSVLTVKNSSLIPENSRPIPIIENFDVIELNSDSDPENEAQNSTPNNKFTDNYIRIIENSIRTVENFDFPENERSTINYADLYDDIQETIVENSDQNSVKKITENSEKIINDSDKSLENFDKVIDISDESNENSNGNVENSIRIVDNPNLNLPVEDSNPVREMPDPVVANSAPIVENSDTIVENCYTIVENPNSILHNSFKIVENSNPIAERFNSKVDNSFTIVKTSNSTGGNSFKIVENPKSVVNSKGVNNLKGCDKNVPIGKPTGPIGKINKSTTSKLARIEKRKPSIIAKIVKPVKTDKNGKSIGTTSKTRKPTGTISKGRKSTDTISKTKKQTDTVITNPISVTKPIDFVVKPVDAIVAKPIETIVSKPVETIVAKPIDTIVSKPIDTIVARPIDTIVTEPPNTIATIAKSPAGTFVKFAKPTNIVVKIMKPAKEVDNLSSLTPDPTTTTDCLSVPIPITGQVNSTIQETFSSTIQETFNSTNITNSSNFVVSSGAFINPSNLVVNSTNLIVNSPNTPQQMTYSVSVIPANSRETVNVINAPTMPIIKRINPSPNSMPTIVMPTPSIASSSSLPFSTVTYSVLSPSVSTVTCTVSTETCSVFPVYSSCSVPTTALSSISLASLASTVTSPAVFSTSESIITSSESRLSIPITTELSEAAKQLPLTADSDYRFVNTASTSRSINTSSTSRFSISIAAALSDVSKVALSETGLGGTSKTPSPEKVSLSLSGSVNSLDSRSSVNSSASRFSIPITTAVSATSKASLPARVIRRASDSKAETEESKLNEEERAAKKRDEKSRRKRAKIAERLKKFEAEGEKNEDDRREKDKVSKKQAKIAERLKKFEAGGEKNEDERKGGGNIRKKEKARLATSQNRTDFEKSCESGAEGTIENEGLVTVAENATFAEMDNSGSAEKSAQVTKRSRSDAISPIRAEKVKRSKSAADGKEEKGKKLKVSPIVIKLGPTTRIKKPEEKDAGMTNKCVDDTEKSAEVSFGETTPTGSTTKSTMTSKYFGKITEDPTTTESVSALRKLVEMTENLTTKTDTTSRNFVGGTENPTTTTKSATASRKFAEMTKKLTKPIRISVEKIEIPTTNRISRETIEEPTVATSIHVETIGKHTTIAKIPAGTIEKPTIARIPVETIEKPMIGAKIPEETIGKRATITKTPVGTIEKPTTARIHVEKIQRHSITTRIPLETIGKPSEITKKSVGTIEKSTTTRISGETIEKPSVLAKIPLETIGKPTVIIEAPVGTIENPTAITKTPVGTIEKPTSAKIPVEIIEKPTTITKTPVETKEKPTTARIPIETIGKPTAVTKAPVETIEKPTIARIPVETIGKPTAITKTPVETIGKPTAIIKAPVGTIEKPTEIIKTPVGIIEKPSITRIPVETIGKPTAIIKTPVETIEKPTTITKPPVETIEKSTNTGIPLESIGKPTTIRKTPIETMEKPTITRIPVETIEKPASKVETKKLKTAAITCVENPVVATKIDVIRNDTITSEETTINKNNFAETLRATTPQIKTQTPIVTIEMPLTTRKAEILASSVVTGTTTPTKATETPVVTIETPLTKKLTKLPVITVVSPAAFSPPEAAIFPAPIKNILVGSMSPDTATTSLSSSLSVERKGSGTSGENVKLSGFPLSSILNSDPISSQNRTGLIGGNHNRSVILTLNKNNELLMRKKSSAVPKIISLVKPKNTKLIQDLVTEHRRKVVELKKDSLRERENLDLNVGSEKVGDKEEVKRNAMTVSEVLNSVMRREFLKEGEGSKDREGSKDQEAPEDLEAPKDLEESKKGEEVKGKIESEDGESSKAKEESKSESSKEEGKDKERTIGRESKNMEKERNREVLKIRERTKDKEELRDGSKERIHSKDSRRESKDRERSQSRRGSRDKDRSESRRESKDRERSQSRRGSKDKDRSEIKRESKDRERSQSRRGSKDKDRSEGRRELKDGDKSQSRRESKDSESSQSRREYKDKDRSESRRESKDRERSQSRRESKDIERSQSRRESKDKDRSEGRRESKDSGSSQSRRESKDRGSSQSSRESKDRGSSQSRRGSKDREKSQNRRESKDKDRSESRRESKDKYRVQGRREYKEGEKTESREAEKHKDRSEYRREDRDQSGRKDRDQSRREDRDKSKYRREDRDKSKYRREDESKSRREDRDKAKSGEEDRDKSNSRRESRDKDKSITESNVEDRTRNEPEIEIIQSALPRRQELWEALLQRGTLGLGESALRQEVLKKKNVKEDNSPISIDITEEESEFGEASISRIVSLEASIDKETSKEAAKGNELLLNREAPKQEQRHEEASKGKKAPTFDEASTSRQASKVEASTNRQASTVEASTSRQASKVEASTSRQASKVEASTSRQASKVEALGSKQASKVEASTSKQASTVEASTSRQASTVIASTSRQASTIIASTSRQASKDEASKSKQASTVEASISQEAFKEKEAERQRELKRHREAQKEKEALIEASKIREKTRNVQVSSERAGPSQKMNKVSLLSSDDDSDELEILEELEILQVTRKEKKADSTVPNNNQSLESVENSQEGDITYSCHVCSSVAEVVCEDCENAFYCSVACQRKHWADGHHKTCKKS